MNLAISIRNATLSYQQQIIFSNLNLEIKTGQWVALLGPSGSGKSSLLRLIAGILPKENNEQMHTDYINASPLAYMGQTDLLLPWATALENILLGCKLRNDYYTSRQSKIDYAKFLLEKVGLEHAINLYPHQLSGGMRQRVALARTLIEDKPIILLDEPFSSLDAITRYKLQALAYELLREKTVLFVTHDPNEALRLADDIYILEGQPAEIKHVATLHSRAPRTFTNPELLEWQMRLFQILENV